MVLNYPNSLNLEVTSNGIWEVSGEQSQHSCTCEEVWAAVEKRKDVNGVTS